jgi:hypothetical protein
VSRSGKISQPQVALTPLHLLTPNLSIRIPLLPTPSQSHHFITRPIPTNLTKSQQPRTLTTRATPQIPQNLRYSFLNQIRLGVADFTSNILRWIAEERLNLAVERPAAICWITGLPDTAPTVAAAAAPPAKASK